MDMDGCYFCSFSFLAFFSSSPPFSLSSPLSVQNYVVSFARLFNSHFSIIFFVCCVCIFFFCIWSSLLTQSLAFSLFVSRSFSLSPLYFHTCLSLHPDIFSLRLQTVLTGSSLLFPCHLHPRRQLLFLSLVLAQYFQIQTGFIHRIPDPPLVIFLRLP